MFRNKFYGDQTYIIQNFVLIKKMNFDWILNFIWIASDKVTKIINLNKSIILLQVGETCAIETKPNQMLST